MEKQNAHPTCKYVDGVSKCCHSSEGYWAVISCGTVYYAVQGDSTLCVFKPNAKVWLFNWNLGFSFTCQFLLSSALQNETWDFSWILCSANSVSEKGILKESASKMSGGGDGRGIVFSASARTSEPRRGRCSKDNAASTAHGKDWNQIGFLICARHCHCPHVFFAKTGYRRSRDRLARVSHRRIVFRSTKLLVLTKTDANVLKNLM